MPKIALVTQDPANYGGVLRLVEYAYARCEANAFEPTVLHYASFKAHPEINASLLNILRGELPIAPELLRYEFQGMRAVAIGGYFPEWEPNRISGNRLWAAELDRYDAFLLVTGSAHVGLPLVERNKKFAAWISSTVDEDRKARLAHASNLASRLERQSLPSVRNAERAVLAAAARVMAVSDSARKSIRGILHRDVETLPFPIDTIVYRSTAELAEVPRILFVGRANDPRKRIELFLDACRELRKLAPNLKFTAATVSSGAPSEDNITFCTEQYSGISRDELVALYSSSTVLAVTSEQEGLGIAAMEAMSCGCPVVSTRCGGPETFIVDGVTGFFCDDTPQSIALQLERVITQPDLRRRLGEASRKQIAMHFSEAAWNSKFDSILQTL